LKRAARPDSVDVKDLKNKGHMREDTQTGEITVEKIQAAEPALPVHSLAVTRAEILALGHQVVRKLLEEVKADPSSDAYAILELLCVNEFMSAKLKTPEVDALDIYRAHNQGKELALKAGHLERQSKLDEAKADKLRLEIQKFQAELAEVRKKVREATEARKQRKRFDYERTLNQISAVVGLRGPEEFRIEEEDEEKEAS
jgi:hypothetical protein